MKNHTKIFSIMLFLSGLAVGNVYAMNYQHNIDASLSTQYETNPRLSLFNKTSVSKSILVPKYHMLASDETNNASITLSYRVERSSNTDISDDRNDPAVDLGWGRELENGGLFFKAHRDKSSTRETELDDTGIITVDGTRYFQSSSLGWTHNISEYLKFSINGSNDEVTYDDVSLVNYNTKSLSTSMNYQYSEFISPFITIGGSTTSFEDEQNDSKSKSIDIGVNWTVDEYISAVFTVGENRTENDGIEETNKTGSILVKMKSERLDSNFSITRSVTPSGVGSFSEADQLKGEFIYALSESSSLSLLLNMRENKNINTNKTKYYSTSYKQDISENFKMSLTASRKELENESGQANNNIYMFSLSYLFL